ncbi:Transposase DDE domain protein [compost metagenome]
MGRSRGGLTSKIHALVDAEGRPVNLRLTGGQIADCTEADALTDGLGEGDILLVDKGYDSNAIRAKAAERRGLGQHPAEDKPQGLFRVLKLGLSAAEPR